MGLGSSNKKGEGLTKGVKKRAATIKSDVVRTAQGEEEAALNRQGCSISLVEGFNESGARGGRQLSL